MLPHNYMQPWEAGMLKYLAAAEPPQQLEFRSRVASFGRTGDSTAASLVVELPLRQLNYREDPNTKHSSCIRRSWRC